MIYSIISAEVVFDDWDGSELDEYQEVIYNNRRVIIQPLENQQARIVQLISTDPVDFLHQDYTPGNIIKFYSEITK